jgi:tetratricopeptide (TPR) repeat protein
MKSSVDMRARILPALGVLLVLAGTACASSERRVRAAKRSDTHVSLAQKLMADQRYSEALNQADLAIKESKKNPDAYLTRGQIEFMRAEYPAAIEDFTTARRYRPLLTEALSWRAWAYIESGNLAAAEADYREGLKDRTYLYPEKLHLNLALLLYKMGRDAEGLVELRSSVSASPAYFRGHYELGKALEKNGDVTGALASYEAAIGGMKDSADLNLRLALALEKAGDGGRARAHFKRVLEISPDGPEATTARDHLKRLEASS